MHLKQQRAESAIELPRKVREVSQVVRVSKDSESNDAGKGKVKSVSQQGKDLLGPGNNDFSNPFFLSKQRKERVDSVKERVDSVVIDRWNGGEGLVGYASDSQENESKPDGKEEKESKQKVSVSIDSKSKSSRRHENSEEVGSEWIYKVKEEVMGVVGENQQLKRSSGKIEQRQRLEKELDRKDVHQYKDGKEKECGGVERDKKIDVKREKSLDLVAGVAVIFGEVSRKQTVQDDRMPKREGEITGKPPGTAESQALMFSIADCGDITGGSVTGPMDMQDPMLLPVLDFSFESFNQPPPEIEEANSLNQECSKDVNPSSAPSAGEFDYLSKAEAMMIFAPEYSAIEISVSNLSTFITSSYLPSSRKIENAQSSSNAYMYSANPPPSPYMEVSDQKADMSSMVRYYKHVQNGRKQPEKRFPADNSGLSCASEPPFSSTNTVVSLRMKKHESSLEPGQFLMSLKPLLAPELECLMLQAAMCRIRHIPLSSTNLFPQGMSRPMTGTVSDRVHADTAMPNRISSKLDTKKKESIPVRIAGDVDGDMLDGPRSAPVGVWRSVGVTKATKKSNSPNIEGSPSLPSNSIDDGGLSVTHGPHPQPLLELLDAMALLVQQSTSFVDISLDADCGDGPYGWLAFQEQRRRGFSCGPSMVHAGCGGTLAACHSLDNAGVELLDLLSADVHPSSVISLLQSDIKVALKSAFGDINMDGPLLVTDWWKGRSQSGDEGYSAECTANEAKDSSSAVTLTVGEPISPPASSTGSASCFKEYAYTLRVNEKSDIYSFGVVILELVTGKHPGDPEFGEAKDLVKWVCATMEKKGVDHVLDPKLSNSYKGEMCKVLNVGLICTNPLPINRPSMRRVVKMLLETSMEKSKSLKKDGKLSPYYYEDSSDQGSIV